MDAETQPLVTDCWATEQGKTSAPPLCFCIFISIAWLIKDQTEQDEGELHLFSTESTFTAVISAGKLGLVNLLNKGQEKCCI